jgi:hypothetical protein
MEMIERFTPRVGTQPAALAGGDICGREAAVVVITAASATAQDRCSLPAASSWSPTETTVWRQLCAGHWATLTPQVKSWIQPAGRLGRTSGCCPQRFLVAVFEHRLSATETPPHAHEVMRQHHDAIVGLSGSELGRC